MSDPTKYDGDAATEKAKWSYGGELQPENREFAEDEEATPEPYPAATDVE